MKIAALLRSKQANDQQKRQKPTKRHGYWREGSSRILSERPFNATLLHFQKPVQKLAEHFAHSANGKDQQQKTRKAISCAGFMGLRGEETSA